MTLSQHTPLEDVPALLSKELQHLSPNAQKNLKSGWLKLVQALAAANTIKGLESVTFEDIEKRRAQLCTEYKVNTVRLAMTVAKQVWVELLRKKVLVNDPWKSVSRFRSARHTDDSTVPMWNVLKPGELEKLGKVLQRGSLERALVLTLTLQGWRRHVVCALKTSQLTTVNGKTYVDYVSKGNKQRRKFMQPAALEAAAAWRKQLGVRSEYFIPNERGGKLNPDYVTQLVVKLCEKHLGHRVTPHGLRATAISEMISRKDIEHARQLADHERIETTRRYSRWALTDDEVREL